MKLELKDHLVKRVDHYSKVWGTSEDETVNRICTMGEFVLTMMDCGNEIYLRQSDGSNFKIVFGDLDNNEVALSKKD